MSGTTPDFLQETALNTAEAFVAALRLTDPRWEPEPTMWCFRGEDRLYPKGIMPSALRPGAFARWHVAMVPHDPKREEWLVTQEFMHAIDEAGLEVPHDSHAIRDIRELFRIVFDEGTNEIVNWPPGQLLGILALAQHYGIPTRLVDWSWKPLVAAYAAAAGPALGRDPGGAAYAPNEQLVVWAMQGFWIPFVQFGPAPHRFSVVTTPKASNPNLAAQSGLFTLDREPSADVGFQDVIEAALRPNLPLFAEGLEKMFGFAPRFLPFMHRFTLPHSEAGRLLRILALEGVSAATVYPGHKGVAQSLWEKRDHRR
jgi:hypothetical protein